MAFAGQCALWKEPESNTVLSCAIITREAINLLRPIHDLMRVILPMEMKGSWLDRDN